MLFPFVLSLKKMFSEENFLNKVINLIYVSSHDNIMLQFRS